MSAAAFASLRERLRRSLSREAGAGADKGTLLTAMLLPPHLAGLQPCSGPGLILEAWGEAWLGQEWRPLLKARRAGH